MLLAAIAAAVLPLLGIVVAGVGCVVFGATAVVGAVFDGCRCVIARHLGVAKANTVKPSGSYYWAAPRCTRLFAVQSKTRLAARAIAAGQFGVAALCGAAFSLAWALVFARALYPF